MRRRVASALSVLLLAVGGVQGFTLLVGLLRKRMSLRGLLAGAVAWLGCALAASLFTLLLLAVLGAVAAAGIPGGSLPIIAGLLITFGVPAEGIGIVLGADRLLDMTRTMVNVGADMVTTAVVDSLERKSSGD